MRFPPRAGRCRPEDDEGGVDRFRPNANRSNATSRLSLCVKIPPPAALTFFVYVLPDKRHLIRELRIDVFR